ncbi:MAG: hypothetical protein OEZ01_11850, partial [Candidatus Heimdallarchaeota archaeon]|nr:hypothetical protein [Candidatus Heimdallarchaeota archaeon]
PFPAGTWPVKQIIKRKSPGKLRTQGPYFIWIDPVTGRVEMAIHGGRSKSPKKSRHPTFGCIRISDEDLKYLVEELIPNLGDIESLTVLSGGPPKGPPPRGWEDRARFQ